MNITMQKISEAGIIPSIHPNDLKNAAAVARALKEGGIHVVEIPCKTDESIEAIRQIASACPDMLIGAGSLISRDLADMAVGAGAAFLITPGYNPHLIEYCAEMGHLVIPGCSTPSDIETAFEIGLSVINLFPAALTGGPGFVRELSDIYPEVDFIVSGDGVAESMVEYLSLPDVLACCTGKLPFADGDYTKITSVANDLMLKALGFSLAHVGVNCDSIDAASASAKTLCDLLGFAHLPSPASVFAGTYAEFMAPPYRGTNGHIGFFTNSVVRAMAWLTKKGVEFIPETMRYTPSGRLRFVYLKNELCGFAIHLTQRQDA